MKFVKNLVLVLVVFLLVGFSFSACSGGSGSSDHPLEGNWTLTTTPNSGAEISGDFSLTHSGNVEIMGMTADFYTGSGSLSGDATVSGTYTIGASESEGMVAFSFSDGTDQDENGDADTLDFEGTISGDTMTGEYYGSPDEQFDSYEGNFTATKQ